LPDLRACLAVLAALLIAVGARAEEIVPDDLDALPHADVVILGEVHDNPWHHENQARAVASMQPVALVFEMLTPEQAARVTPDLRRDADALSRALDWDASGWPDFAMYAPIFAAAPLASIIGGALPRDQVRRVMTEPAAAVFGPDAAVYGLDQALSPRDQALREAEQMAAHCNALPADVLPGIVAAQRLRDAVMARAVVEARAASGGPIVVITGTGHARNDQGIPAALRHAAPALSVLSVGQLERGDVGEPPPHDFWIVTEAAARQDPCAGFDAQGG